MLKQILLKAIQSINAREAHNEEVMRECVSNKLERSLSQYESNLEKTCKYIISKNPVSTIKALASDTKKKNVNKQEEDK